MANEKVVALAELVKHEVEKVCEKPGIKECLENNKVVLVVSKDEVKVKVSEPTLRKPKKEKFSLQDKENLKEIKKRLKGRADLIYLCTLIISLNAELKKVDVDELEDEVKKVLVPVLNLLKVKQLEVSDDQGE